MTDPQMVLLQHKLTLVQSTLKSLKKLPPPTQSPVRKPPPAYTPPPPPLSSTGAFNNAQWQGLSAGAIGNQATNPYSQQFYDPSNTLDMEDVKVYISIMGQAIFDLSTAVNDILTMIASMPTPGGTGTK